MKRGSERADVAYHALHRAIIEQALEPGTKLREDQLGAHFGISRTLVRIALARLVGMFALALLDARERPGPYGGSLENRTRLARDIIAAIRAEAPGLVIASRLNVYDAIPFGKHPGTDAGEPCPCRTPLACALS